MEKKHNCEQCQLRQRYDRNPKSLLGRFWRWHISFAPGGKPIFSRSTSSKNKRCA